MPDIRASHPKSCPICDSDNLHLFMNGIFDSESTDVIECHACGLQFLDPMMSDEEEAEFYDNYYQKQKNRHFKTMDLEDFQRRAFDHYEQYRDVYLDLVAEAKSLLEIGSGSGGFLKFVKQYRPDIQLVAYERDPQNVKFINECFGDGVRLLSNLEQDAESKFDCVVALGVFEHIKRSNEFLDNMRDRMNIGGTLVLMVPNKMHPLVYTYELDEFKKFTYMKQHYYTFTEQSFHQLAVKSGYKVKGFKYIQVWGFDNHLSWLRYRKPRDFSAISSTLSKETINAYNQDMIKQKTTDVMIAVFSLQA
jgi:cyclopropane fatty-acyl-phospholipid synthase-like methyltransferase